MLLLLVTSPVINAGGQTNKNNNGGKNMPLVTPKLGLTTADDYQVNLNLPSNSFIK